jgi:hypothetical protein
MKVGALAKILGKHRGRIPRGLADYRQGDIKAVVELGTSSGRTRRIPDWALLSLNKQLEEP